MTEITKENVMKIKCHRYFDDNKINKEIYHKTLILMGKAYSYKGNETLLLMDNKSYNYRVTTQLRPYRVDLSGEMIFALSRNSDHTFTAFHNHPNDSRFSLGDVNVLLEYEKLVLLILCTNNCKYSMALFKTKKCTKRIAKILSNLIKITFKLGVFTINSPGIPIIKWLCKHGFLYAECVNY